MEFLLAVGCAVSVLLLLVDPLRSLLLFLEELRARSGVSRQLYEPLCKTIGIAFVVKVGGELCRDAGESAMAAVVETAGTVCALLVALPLMQAVLTLVLELMQ
jgi:stage III sporulation protein AD